MAVLRNQKSIKNRVLKFQVISVFKNEFCFYFRFKLLNNMMHKLKQYELKLIHVLGK